MSLKKLTYAQRHCLKRMLKTMHSKSMICPDARVGVAVSGGVDSFVMLKLFTLVQKRLPFSFEIMVLHINPGFDPQNHLPLIEWVKENGIAAHIEVGDMGIKAHSSENKKNSPCFFCTWRRRKRLFELVKKYGLTHLAFGHNGDDLIDTFFMNLFYAGRIEGMFPKESFFNGEFELIRPIIGIEKSWIKKAASEWQLPVWENPCPSAKNTKRNATRIWLEDLWKKNKKIKKSIYSAVYRFVLFS